ncbi:MAG: hypothetical protein KJO07_09570, partial [Deltaproteobacteria bacterium]|nr:hypothetical protein [Deltaproteobacteria bacterium]
MRLVRFASLSLLLVAAACGDDDGGGGGADAGDEVDSGPDIDADDRPTSGTCGIAVNLEALLGTQKNGLPEELPSAVFSNPDGSLIGVETLDVQGRAQRTDCVRDTIVSLVVEPEYGLTGETGPLPVTTPGFVITFANVQPNDTAQVGSLPDSFDEPELVGTINVSVPADLSGFGTSPPTSWEVSAGPGCDADGGFILVPSGVTPIAALEIYDNCVEPDGTVNIYAYATRNGEGVAYATLTGVDADATPNTALTAWTPADLATAAVGSNLDTSTFGYLDAYQAIGTVPLVGSGNDYSRGALTVARTYNGMPPEVATGGNYTQVTASSNSSEFALQNFTENPRVSQVAVSSPAQATSVVDMS